MSRPFITTCPHCSTEITIPYEVLSRHVHTQIARRTTTRQSFADTCPRCGAPIALPYQDVSLHVHREIGRRSGAQRGDRVGHVRSMAKKRWSSYEHPKQNELLELARAENISTLPMTAIADRLGIEGRNRRYRGVIVKRLLQRLEHKGLLPTIATKDRYAKQKAILALAQREDLGTLTLKEIAERVGYAGKNGPHYVAAQLRRLQRRGLLPDLTIARLHPKQAALLELSKREGLEHLSLPEIAQKVGISGPARLRLLRYHLKQLQAKGLFPEKE